MSKPIPQLGYHYYPDEIHYTELDISTWLPRLDSLGAKWLTILGSQNRAIPEFFLKGLIEANITPIIHIDTPLEKASRDDLLPLFASYARWGVRYVIVSDRPNLRLSWSETAWGRKALVERFLDLMLPILEAQRSSGLIPVLPPLEPGGDYWDTAFLQGALVSILRRGLKSLLDELTLTLYAWAYDRPIDWGAGGSTKWVETKPYYTPPGSQDQCGFRISDWYSEISINAIERSLPMLAIAGGARLASDSHKVSPDEHTEKNLSITRTLESNDISPSLKGFCFYLLGADESHPHYKDAWYPTDAEPLPIVQGIQKLISSSSKGIRKSLAHYVLLPDRIEPVEVLGWEALVKLLKEKQPTFGFSPLEARLAQEVTIAGGEELIPSSVEEDLRKTGCTVQRIQEKDAENSDVQGYLDYFLSNILGEKHG
jgi:hypothetical protein